MRTAPDNRRILIVDDNPAIHRDFEKILSAPGAPTDDLDALEAALFEVETAPSPSAVFELTFASQGKEALALATAAKLRGAPYALAFVDMRMPPGWDGLETIERIWQVDPDMQIVICSAYTDYSWSDLKGRLGDRDSLLIVKKPFDAIEIVQCAHALTTKWTLAQTVRAHLEHLEQSIEVRTAELVRANQLLADEIRERDRVEEELRLSQRLKAIGQLAAGIAHEISTPVQYVCDHLQFLREGFEQIAAATQDLPRTDELAFVFEALPEALDSIEHGVGRISKIVSSVREFSHPGSSEMAMADLNRALTNALAVSANSFEYFADPALELGALPLVRCHAGELNQVFLNLILNAAHAMETRPQRGTLGVRTRVEGEDVIISISDTGCGIPREIRERIFDAFFTTKPVGQGTGQGLGISRTIIVDRHAGALTFESIVEVGTTFHVRIPIAGPSRSEVTTPTRRRRPDETVRA